MQAIEVILYVQGNIYTSFIFTSFTLVVSRQFKPQAAVVTTAFSKGGAYQDKSMSQIISLLSQLLQGEFKTRGNHLQVKKEKITWCKNKPVYSNQTIVHVPVCNENLETMSWLGHPSVWDTLYTVSSSTVKLLHFPTVSMDSCRKTSVTMNTMFDVLPTDQNCLFLPNIEKIKVN